MKSIYHDVGSGIRISFDDEKNSLHVSIYTIPILGLAGEWEEVATFTKGDDWYASPFSKMVSSQYHQEMIIYFWIDVSHPMTQ